MCVSYEVLVIITINDHELNHMIIRFNHEPMMTLLSTVFETHLEKNFPQPGGV